MDINYKMLYESVGVDFDKGLRPLSDMTEEEAIEMYNHLFPWTAEDPNKQAQSNVIKNQLDENGIYHEGKVSLLDYVDWFPYLLSKGFDLFGLIDAGLAINSTTLNNGKE